VLQVERNDLGVNLAARAGPADVDAFQLEQLDLGHQSTRKAGETSVRSDHTMARDHDGNRIGTHRLPHGSRLVRLPDVPRELTVGRHMAVPDLQELIVDLLLEVRRYTREVEIEVEGAPGLREVLLQLLDRRAQLRRPGLGWVGMSLFR